MHKKNTSWWARYWSVVVLALVLVLSAFLFTHKQALFHCDLPINEKMFDAYGSFVGGVLAFISVFLLVETLRDQRTSATEQREFIREQRRQTEEQLMLIREQSQQVGEGNFNSLFWGLLQHLQKEIEMLEFETYTGKSYFGVLCQCMQESFILEPTGGKSMSYENNVYWATWYYMGLYARHPELASYFRLLYRICEIVDKAKLKDERKVEYMKILRAQLTSGELFMLRYNAYTPDGVQFQLYIRKYNLLKHLPVFDLLELKNWWEVMNEIQRYQASTFVSFLRRDLRRILEGDDCKLRQDGFKNNGWVYELEKESSYRVKVLMFRVDGGVDKIFLGIPDIDLRGMEKMLRCVLLEIFMHSRFNEAKLKGILDVVYGQWSQDSSVIACTVVSKHDTALLPLLLPGD